MGSSSFRTRSTLSHRRQRGIGRRLESLEDRKMMFGDAVSMMDPGIDLPMIELIPNGGMVKQDLCIDFEDMPAAGSYVVGDTFVADNSGLQAKFSGEGFTWESGVVTVGGAATVSHANLAADAGQEIGVNNILLNVDFGATVPGVRLKFGEYGGNLNLDVNGTFVNFRDFHDIDGAMIGGVSVSVVNGFGNDAGELALIGNVNSLKIGGQELWIDHICVGELPQVERLDWGDAPDEPYPTLGVNNGAHHLIDSNVHLGKRVEPELDGQPTIAADGDDQNVGLNVDDEDGVVFISPLVPGQMAQVEVEASIDGWLNAWVDFDRDGSWVTNPNENIFSGQALSVGTNILNFLVPATAKPGPNDPTYSRWRFSTTDKVLRPMQLPGTPVPNGEVEDHLAFIQDRPDPQERWDFGDAPEQPFPTTLAANGARHLIDPKIYLGSLIDAEADGQPTYSALGDDAAGVDDEDGVRFLSPIVPGKEVKIEVTASVDGRLDAWVDFDQDGNWQAAEQIAVSTPLAAGPNFLTFAVPTTAVPTPIRPVYSRFRFSTAGGLAPKGPARNGEVEDYRSLNGDLNNDGKINEADVDLLCRAIHAGARPGDLNGDGAINEDDMDYLIHDILGTDYGDANLDGIFNSADLVLMFRTGQYEDDIPNNSGWAQGDFDCDGDFTTADLVKAMQTGTYSPSARPVSARAVDLIGAVLDGLDDDNLEDALGLI